MELSSIHLDDKSDGSLEASDSATASEQSDGGYGYYRN